MPWLTTEQVAAELSVTTRSIERWRESGVLIPEQRTRGNHSRYSEEQICKFKVNRDLQQMML